MTHPFVYLASQSPRRAQLLEQLGVAHRPLVAQADEGDEDDEALEAMRAGEGAEDYVRRVTRAKLTAARQRLARRALATAPILCADTTVAIGATLLGKPSDADEARTMLARLSDRVHRVCTAVAVFDGKRAWQALSVSRVWVAALDRAAVDAYLASGEPFGKAGAYAIQGRFAAHVARIDGSHSGIMGLPLHETAHLLRKARVAF